MDVKRPFGSNLIAFEDSFRACFLFCERALWGELTPKSQTLSAHVLAETSP